MYVDSYTGPCPAWQGGKGLTSTEGNLNVTRRGLGALEPQRYGSIEALVRVGFSLDG